MIGRLFLQFHTCSLPPVVYFLCCTEACQLDVIPFVKVCFCCLCFGAVSQKLVPRPTSWNICLCFLLVLSCLWVLYEAFHLFWVDFCMSNPSIFPKWMSAFLRITKSTPPSAACLCYTVVKRTWLQLCGLMPRFLATCWSSIVLMSASYCVVRTFGNNVLSLPCCSFCSWLLLVVLFLYKFWCFSIFVNNVTDILLGISCRSLWVVWTLMC